MSEHDTAFIELALFLFSSERRVGVGNEVNYPNKCLCVCGGCEQFTHMCNLTEI